MRLRIKAKLDNVCIYTTTYTEGRAGHDPSYNCTDHNTTSLGGEPLLSGYYPAPDPHAFPCMQRPKYHTRGIPFSDPIFLLNPPPLHITST